LTSTNISVLNNSLTKVAGIEVDSLSFFENGFLNGTLLKPPATSTAINTLFLPDSSGNLVISVNGNTAGTNGNVTLPVPTLQQVTASGNSTDIGILVADSGNVDTVEITPGNVKIYYDPSGEFVQIDKNTVTFNNGNFDLDIVNPTLTAARTINIPDASGIFALSVNGVGADANGNVTLPITAPYKVYTASLTFNGTSNPIVTVYQNTIGNGSGDGVNDIAITIQNFGLWFEANMTGSTAFPAGKTWMQPSLYFGNSNLYNVYFYRMSNTQIRFQSIDTTDNSVSFANGFSVNFEIRVYP
jgi:hypothetical protein